MNSGKRRGEEIRLKAGWAFTSARAAAMVVITAFVTVCVAAEGNDGVLTLNLKVRMPDGSPAAGAIVESLHQYAELDAAARADEAGMAMIREVFGNGARIRARSADGAFQATLQVMAHEARHVFEHPVELNLLPAIEHQVVVVAEGKPAAAVQVVVAGHRFKVFGITGRDGVAVLKLPADDQVNEIVAWHRQRGVAGMRDLSEGIARGPTSLTLLAPAPLTIRLVDPQGQPVPRVELRASFRTEDSKDWIIASDVADTQVRTNDEGKAVVGWAPRDKLKYVDVKVIGSAWKEDETGREQLSQRIVTVHVRRQRTVEGRLLMPDGASAEGLLVTGFGFGPGHSGCIPEARAGRDGTFKFDCPSEHGLVLGVFDREWASIPWSGLVLASDDDEQAKIDIPVRTAIPITVRVTRGADHVPAANAWIDLEQRGEVHWIDAQGKDQDGSGRVGGWLRTDSKGVAHGGVARGEIHLNVQCGKWFEERTLEVKTVEPIDVEFHRPWLGDRKVVARMSLNGAAYVPSPNLVAKAWSERNGFIGPAHEPIIRDDHTIEVSFDEENLKLLVIDRERRLNGFTGVGPEADSAELVMWPTATYSGTLLDENGGPLADRTLRMLTESSWLDVAEPQRTDSAGRFRFSAVAVKTPLRLGMGDEAGLPKYLLYGYRRMFEPGEVREGDNIQTEQMNRDMAVPQPKPPLAERLADSLENARVAGMHVLVVLQGGDSKNVVRLIDRVLDLDNDAVLAYLPVTVSASELESESATLTERKWPKPAGGELVLVALDGRQQLLGAQEFRAGDVDTAALRAQQFLTRHRPPVVDARAKLLLAREEAERYNRRVWVISGGPRCGPCFRLARWIDAHHELLEKDYAIVKVLGGVDEHADEIGQEIGGGQHGIPWHVITEPDGKIIVTSEGPLGNIGVPGSVEGIRHFRSMLEKTCRRLSSTQIDELVSSLEPEK